MIESVKNIVSLSKKLHDLKDDESIIEAL